MRDRPPGAGDQRAGDDAASETRMAVTHPGIRLSFLRWQPEARASTGRRLVILHGVTGNAMSWGPVARQLAAEGRTVDAPDLPGHGLTRWLDDDGRPLPDQELVDPGRYELAAVGTLVAAALDALPAPVPASGMRSVPGPPAILGHSWGTGVAAAAIDAGLAADRVIFLEPPVLAAGRADELAASYASWLRPGASLDEARDLLRSEGMDADAIEAGAHAMAETSPLAAGAIARGALAHPLQYIAEWRARHAGLRVDVIAGQVEAGGMVPPPALRMFGMALGPDHVHVLPGLGHSPYREDRRRFVDLLRRLLADPA